MGTPSSRLRPAHSTTAKCLASARLRPRCWPTPVGGPISTRLASLDTPRHGIFDGSEQRTTNKRSADLQVGPRSDMAAKRHRIAVIPGDGIGQEVIPAALTVLEAVASRAGFTFDLEEFP